MKYAFASAVLLIAYEVAVAGIVTQFYTDQLAPLYETILRALQ